MVVLGGIKSCVGVRGCLVLGEKVLCSPNQSRGMAKHTVLGLIRHVNDLTVRLAPWNDYLMENDLYNNNIYH